jgi:hypothetical protein
MATLSQSEKWDPDSSRPPTVETVDMLRYLVCRLIYTSSPDHDDLHATLSTSEITEAEEQIDKTKW